MVYERMVELQEKILYPNREDYSSDKDYAEAKNIYREKENELMNLFEKELRKEYLDYLQNYPAQVNIKDFDSFHKKAFSYAYSEGHSGGFSEIENFYDDIVELARL